MVRGNKLFIVTTAASATTIGNITIALEFSRSSADGKATKIALQVRNARNTGAVIEGAVGGINLPVDPKDASKVALIRNFKIKDADKAVPVIDVASILDATGRTIPDDATVPEFKLRLSRNVSSQDVAVKLQAIYNDGTTNHQGTAQTITFDKDTDTTTDKTISNLALPAEAVDDLVNISDRTGTVKIVATIMSGANSETETSGRRRIAEQEFTLIDSEANQATYEYAFAPTTAAEGATSTFTLTLAAAADAETTYNLVAGDGGTTLLIGDYSFVKASGADAGVALSFNKATKRGTLTVPKGIASVPLTFTAANDNFFERDEQFTLALTYAGDDGKYKAKAGQTSPVSLTIRDGTYAHNRVELSNENSSGTKQNWSATEGESTNLTFSYAMGGGLVEQNFAFGVTMNIYPVGGNTPVAGVYPSLSGTEWTANPNDKSKGTITIVKDSRHDKNFTLALAIPEIDSLYDPAYEVRFSFSKPTTGIGSLATIDLPTTVAITDDDRLTISYRGVPDGATQASSNRNSRILLNGAAPADTSINLKLEGTETSKFTIKAGPTTGQTQITLTETNQAYSVKAGVGVIPLIIEVKDVAKGSGSPAVQIVAAFASASAGVIGSTNPVKSNAVQFISSRKGVAFGRVGSDALVEGETLTLVLAVNPALDDSDGSKLQVVFRPNDGSPDINYGNKNLATGNTQYNLNFNIRADGIVTNTPRSGQLIATLTTDDAAINGVSNKKAQFALPASITNAEGAYIIWSGSQAATRQNIKATEGATFTPQASIYLVPPSGVGRFNNFPILEEDLTVNLTLTPTTTGGHTPLMSAFSKRPTSLTFKANTTGDRKTRASDTANNIADFIYDDTIITTVSNNFTLAFASTEIDVGESTITAADAVAQQKNLDLEISNNDTSTFTVSAGDPIVEPGDGTGNAKTQTAADGSIVLDLGLADRESIGERFTFRIIPTITGGGTLKNWAMDGATRTAGWGLIGPLKQGGQDYYTLTAPKGLTHSNDSATLKTGFTGTASDDNFRTAVSLVVAPEGAAAKRVFTTGTVEGFDITDADSPPKIAASIGYHHRGVSRRGSHQHSNRACHAF